MYGLRSLCQDLPSWGHSGDASGPGSAYVPAAFGSGGFGVLCRLRLCGSAWYAGWTVYGLCEKGVEEGEIRFLNNGREGVRISLPDTEQALNRPAGISVLFLGEENKRRAFGLAGMALWICWGGRSTGFYAVVVRRQAHVRLL